MRDRSQSTVRSTVEHRFQVMKRVFGFTKARYLGLLKNARRVHVTCALVNLFLVGKRLLKTALEMESCVRFTEMNSNASPVGSPQPGSAYIHLPFSSPLFGEQSSVEISN